MKPRARWTIRLTLSLGVYLLFAPEIWAVDGEAASFLNSRMVGVCIVGVCMWTLGIPRLKGTECIRVVLGCWLLAAPFALGYGATAAWNDRIVGALTLAMVGLGSAPFALLAWLRANILRCPPQRITAKDISSSTRDRRNRSALRCSPSESSSVRRNNPGPAPCGG